MRPLPILILLFLTLALPLGAQLSLPEVDPVRVWHEQWDSGLIVWAQNLQGADLTLTLDVDPSGFNTVCMPTLPATFQLPEGQKVKLCEVRCAEPARWSFPYRWNWTWGSTRARHDDRAVYSLPYASGQTFPILQGYNGSFSHYGDFAYALDFDMPEGAPVLACRDGVVAAVEEDFSEGGVAEAYRNRGNYVMVRHADGTLGSYDHLRYMGGVVEPGQTVRAGDLIGYVGTTGYSSAPHLHFMVFRAIDGRSRQSYPTRFRVAGSSQPVELQEGQSYTAP